MNLTLKYVTLSILFLTINTFSKDNSAEVSTLTESLRKYKEIQMSGDMSKTLDYIYPPIFTITSKEMLLKGFEIAKKSEKMPKIISFIQTIDLPLKSYSKGYYTTVPYTIEMSMDMTPPVDKENKKAFAKVENMLANPKELNSYKAFTLNMLKMSMGKDAVIDSKEGSLLVNIKKSSKYLAINEAGNGWKFVDVSPLSISQIKSILPKTIVLNEKELFHTNSMHQEEAIKKMMEMIKK